MNLCIFRNQFIKMLMKAEQTNKHSTTITLVCVCVVCDCRSMTNEDTSTDNSKFRTGRGGGIWWPV